MRIGISTPIVIHLPGVSSAWERTGTVADLIEIARTADTLGFDYLTCSEHIALPREESADRGVTYWDPLAVLSFLAARTDHIRLTTSVLVLGYHHPLAIAKRYGTLDVLSGGRLTLGVGVGSAAAEFDLLGADFDGRGQRADDAIQALRASLSIPQPEYRGSHYTFSGLVVEPHAIQPHVPIWVGGRTLRSLRRAVQYADGWMPFGLNTREIGEMLGCVDIETPVDSATHFDIVLPTGRAIDPLNDPNGTTARLDALRDAGATAVTCSIAATSATHYCDQLVRLSQLVA